MRAAADADLADGGMMADRHRTGAELGVAGVEDRKKNITLRVAAAPGFGNGGDGRRLENSGAHGALPIGFNVSRRTQRIYHTLYLGVKGYKKSADLGDRREVGVPGAGRKFDPGEASTD